MDYIQIPGIDSPYTVDRLSAIDYEGMMPIRNIREQSPRLVGTRIVDTFYQERSGTLVLNIEKEDKDYIFALFSPERTKVFEKPFVYHKETLGGKKYTGNDASVIQNSNYVFSNTAKFVDGGGLFEGSWITVGGIKVQILQHFSDSAILVDYTFPADADNVSWEYISGTIYRTLDFYIDGGFKFFRTGTQNSFTREVIDIIAGHPFWVGYRQELVWGDILIRDDKTYPMTYPADELYDLYITKSEIPTRISSHVEVKPTISIYGKMLFFRIDNKTQGTYIEYTQELSLGQHVIIDLQDATAVLYPEGTNVLSFVVGDLTTFTLMPFLVNEMSVNTDSITTTSLTTVSWRNLYLGSQYDRV